MESITSLSVDKDQMDQSVSGHNNVDDSETGGDEHKTLLDELEKTTDDFMKVICTTKKVTTTSGIIRVKPLDAIVSLYERLDAFIISADKVFKWYEADRSRLQGIIDELLINATVPNELCNESTQNIDDDMKKTIIEQNDTPLKEAISSTVSFYEQKTNGLKKKIEQMEVAENEMKNRIAEFGRKEAESKECIEQLQIKADTGEFLSGAYKIKINEKDDTIYYLKQKLEEACHL